MVRTEHGRLSCNYWLDTVNSKESAGDWRFQLKGKIKSQQKQDFRLQPALGGGRLQGWEPCLPSPNSGHNSAAGDSYLFKMPINPFTACLAYCEHSGTAVSHTRAREEETCTRVYTHTRKCKEGGLGRRKAAVFLVAALGLASLKHST